MSKRAARRLTAQSPASANAEIFSRRLLGRFTGISLIPWIFPTVIVIVWQTACSYGIAPPNLLPTPTAVIMAGWRLTLTGELPYNIAVSSCRAVGGLLLGGGIGFLLGLANGLSHIAATLTDTTLQMLRNIPHLAMIPLVILWFGVEEEAKLFLVALGVFFPVYLNTLHGIRSVDPRLVEMAKSYGVPTRDLVRLVVLPGALPSFFVGLRYALGVMWMTLIVSETIAAQSGIGYMAMQAREFMLVDVVVLSILIYALLGKLADVTARLLERRYLPWRLDLRRE